MKTCLKTAAKNNMCVRVIGDKTGLADDIRESIAALEEASKDNTGLHFQVAINYGSRDEIVRATNRIIEDISNKTIKGPVTEELISEYLDTKGIPEPDLLIRTSGEQRLSNFLLWQMAYTEFYFTDVHWPDFSKEELVRACEAYASRDRRFGNHS
jgi:undecaprenyl diphosphate synthase